MTLRHVQTGLLVTVFLAPAFAQTPDALDETLAQVGLRRFDLGWRPKGWWSRFPADIPYKLRHFDDLFAEPLATVTFTRMMGHAARIHLDPEALATPAAKSDGHLYQAVHALASSPSSAPSAPTVATSPPNPLPLTRPSSNSIAPPADPLPSTPSA